MNDLDLNLVTAIPLLVAIAASLTTLNRVGSAIADRRELLRAMRDEGLYTDPVALAVTNHAIRRECIRMVKHAIIISAVAMSFTPWLNVEYRNVAFALVSIGMMSNSLFDASVQRFAMRSRAIELQRLVFMREERD
jgi:hypothetical protein